jgi:hypothetical protein
MSLPRLAPAPRRRVSSIIATAGFSTEPARRASVEERNTPVAPAFLERRRYRLLEIWIEWRCWMSNKLMMLAIAAAVAAGTSSAALAQVCPAGYALYGGVCQPAGAPGYAYAPSNPVSGAATGAASGAAAGGAAAGPVGAIVGGAIGTATGTVAGTANMVTGAPVAAYGGVPPAPVATCAPGWVLYSGSCYPR